LTTGLRPAFDADPGALPFSNRPHRRFPAEPEEPSTKQNEHCIDRLPATKRRRAAYICFWQGSQLIVFSAKYTDNGPNDESGLQEPVSGCEERNGTGF